MYVWKCFIASFFETDFCNVSTWRMHEFGCCVSRNVVDDVLWAARSLKEKFFSGPPAHSWDGQRPWSSDKMGAVVRHCCVNGSFPGVAFPIHLHGRCCFGVVAWKATCSGDVPTHSLKRSRLQQLWTCPSFQLWRDALFSALWTCSPVHVLSWDTVYGSLLIEGFQIYMFPWLLPVPTQLSRKTS